MSPIPEAKTGAPNIQDVFLNYARREKLPVTLHLLDGREFEARIKYFDRFALIVEHGGMDHLIFKARHRHHSHAPQRAELLLVSSSLMRRLGFKTSRPAGGGAERRWCLRASS